MIPGVVHLGSELDLDPLAHAEVLDHREIPASLAVATDPAEAKREGPDVAIQLLVRVSVEPRFGVEPAIGVALALR